MKQKAGIAMTVVLAASITSTAFAADTVGIRQAVEAKGGVVTYHASDKSVDIQYLDTHMHFVIGADTITVNGGKRQVSTALVNQEAVMDADTLEQIMKGAETMKNTAEIQLELGKVVIYDFGNIRLHAYLSNDALYDVCYLVEKGDAVVLIESGAFDANVAEWDQYIQSLGKTVAGQLMAYHPNGADHYDAEVYATENAVKNWGEGGSIRALTDGFVVSFGDAVAEEIPAQTNIISAGDTIVLGDITFRIVAADDDAYSIEIPEINCIYRHMMGSQCHNILASMDAIDAEIAAMESYQEAGYTLILTSHYDPEGQEAVFAKIEYLKKTKEIVQSCDTAEAFIAAMQQEFPNYSGVNYLEMTAGMLFQ